MTEEQMDQVYETKEKIWTAVHDTVDNLTKGLDPSVDMEVRQQMTETFRFWRRK